MGTMSTRSINGQLPLERAATFYFLNQGSGFLQVKIEEHIKHVTPVYVGKRPVPYLVLSTLDETEGRPGAHAATARWVADIQQFVLTSAGSQPDCKPVVATRRRPEESYEIFREHLEKAKQTLADNAKLREQLCRESRAVLDFADQQVAKPMIKRTDIVPYHQY
jgi:hypothetical protein